MTKEIDQLHRLEETTLTSDLAQGKFYKDIKNFSKNHINENLSNLICTQYMMLVASITF